MEGFEGYAAVTDPRERFDDLLVDSGSDVREPETYAEHREMEAFRSGWVAVGVVLDDADRVLFAYDGEDELWVLPGGTLRPGETLDEGLVREVREETGVDVEPVRPHAVGENRIENVADATEWTGFRVVLLEARAASTAVGDDLGVDDEAIERAEWFEDLPADVFNPDFTRRAVERARDR